VVVAWYLGACRAVRCAGHSAIACPSIDHDADSPTLFSTPQFSKPDEIIYLAITYGFNQVWHFLQQTASLCNTLQD